MSTLIEAAEAMNALTGMFAGTRDEMVNFLITPADGGPDLDGNVLMTVSEGVQVKRPSLAKLLTVVGGVQGRYFMSYADMIATPGEAFGQMATVAADDAGTHVEPGGSAPVPNPGYYVWTDAATDYWKRAGALLTADIAAALDTLASGIAQAESWAEGAGEPGGAGTKSAKGWSDDAENWAQGTGEPGGAGSKSAKAWAEEVADLIVGLPVGTDTAIYDGAPPANRGVAGDAAYDRRNRVLYLAKRATGWTKGISLAALLAAGAPGATVPATVEPDVTIYDTTAALPAGNLTCTRAQSTTDLTWEDDRTTYQIFAANEPIVHPTRGILSFQYMEQLAPNPVNPGNGTFTFTAPSAGRYIIWGKGAGTATSAPGDTGPATATGFGTRTLADIGYQVIVVTSPGTVKVTLAGTNASTLIQCEYNPALPTLSVPTPFKPTAGVRHADQVKAVGALAAVLQAAAGYMEIDVRIPVRTAGAELAILGMGNIPVFHSNGDQTYVYYDSGSFVSPNYLGSRSFTGADPVRLAFTWDASTLRYAAGDRVPTERPHTLAAGLSRATICLGSRYNSDIYGQGSLNGAISRIAFANTPALVSSEELYRRYSPIRLPTLADIVPDFDAKRDMPETVARISQMLANPGSEFLPIFVLGNSSAAGVPVRSNGWPVALAARLTARGVPAYANSFCGTNGGVPPWSGGTNAYDGRATYSGAAPSSTGLHPSNGIVRIPAGTALTIAFATTLTKLQVWTTRAPGNGSYQVSAGAGPIAPDGGGSATVSTDGELALTAKSFTGPAASTWTITASGGNVDLQMAIDATPGRIQIIEGASSGASASVLAIDESVTSSFWHLPRAVAGPLTLLTPDHGNSSINSIPMATYRAAVATQIAKAKAIGDVIAMTHMTFAPELAPDVRDRAYAMVQSAVAQTGGAKVYDFRAWEARTPYATMHAAGFYYEANLSGGLHLHRTANDWMVAATVGEMIGSAWTAAGGALT